LKHQPWSIRPSIFFSFHIVEMLAKCKPENRFHDLDEMKELITFTKGTGLIGMKYETFKGTTI